MKVLLVNPNGSLDNGVSLCLLTMAKLLRENGIEVVVIVPLYGDLIDKLNEEGIHYYIIKQYNNWYVELKKGKKMSINPFKTSVKFILNRISLGKIKSIIKLENIDIVHVNALTTYLAAKAALSMNVKLVWHIREFVEEDLQITFLNKKKAYQLINKSNSIIAISKSILDKYNKLLECDNIELVYDGIDEHSYFYKKSILTNENIQLTLAGRLVPEKGQFEFIKAINELYKRGYKNLRALIIGGKGTGDYLKSLNNYVRENNLSNIISIKEYSSDMNSVWKSTDIACVCSKAEAFGRVTIEAMLAGALVVGANTGGTLDLLENNKTGYLYEQGNYYDLAEKIEYAINNTDKSRNIAIAGQKGALDNFTAKENVRRIIGIYNKSF